jgi:hypothetical protein
LNGPIKVGEDKERSHEVVEWVEIVYTVSPEGQDLVVWNKNATETA